MTTKKEISIKDYREVLNTIELEHVCLIEANFKIQRELLSDEIKLVTKETFKFEKKYNLLIVFYKTVLKGVDIKTTNASITATVVHEVSYSLTGEKEVTPEFMDKFGEFSTSMVVWPFFREYIQNMVSRTQLPQLTLPLKKQ
jgi:hypothetical protein